MNIILLFLLNNYVLSVFYIHADNCMDLVQAFTKKQQEKTQEGELEVAELNMMR